MMPCGRRSSLPQLRVRLLPNAFAARFVQQLVDSEIALQLQVRPMVERIAQRVGHGARPRQKFLLGRPGSGAVLFADPIGPHGAPFVVVALQPDFEKILEAAVLGYLPRRQMAMIVEDGFVLGIFVIQPLRGLAAEEKIVMDEGHRIY